MYASSPKDDFLKRHSIFRESKITALQDFLIRFLENLRSKIIFLLDQSLLDYENHTDFEKCF